MAIKVNSLNPFDKGFFGRPMSGWTKMKRNSGEILHATQLKMSSFDDFNRHFDDKVFASKFEKTPVTDVMEKEQNPEFTEHFPSIF